MLRCRIWLWVYVWMSGNEEIIHNQFPQAHRTRPFYQPSMWSELSILWQGNLGLPHSSNFLPNQGDRHMKKILFLLLAVSLLSSLLFAGDFKIGTGTSTQNYVPLYGYNNYGWSKTIYTSSELAAAGMSGTVTINKIAFQLGNVIQNYVTDNQIVYMGINYNDTYASTAAGYQNPTSYTKVFEGPITWNGPGWVEITLDTPYNCNSAYNLELLWENRDGSKTAGPPKFRYTSKSYSCVYKYSDASFPAVSGTRYGNRPNIWFMSAPTAIPPIAEAVSPVNAATDVAINEHLKWFHTGGSPEYYTVNFGSDYPPTDLLSGYQTTSTLFDYPGYLDYGTTYYWQVIPHNSFGDATDCPIWSFDTVADPSIVSFPHNEGFDAAIPPAGDWQRYGGVLADPIVLGGSSMWQSDDWLNISSADKAAKINIFANVNGWLVTPLFNIPNDNYYLAFDLAVLKYGQTPTGDLPVAAPDDKIAVLIGDGFTWSTANIVREWNNTGSPFVFGEIRVDGERVVIPLSGHSGHIRIAFYAGSLISNADNDVMINNLEVGEFSAAPLAAINPIPADLAVDVPLNQSFGWVSGGGVPAAYKLYLGTSLPDSPEQVLSPHFHPAELGYGNTYFWKVIPTNPIGDAVDCPVWSFTTTDTGTYDAGTVMINELPVNPTVQIEGLEGSVSITVSASYEPVGMGLPNVGLVLQLACNGTSLAGTQITVHHGLGFIPSQLGYRILPSESWTLISNPGTWTDATASFMIDAKAAGDVDIAFPNAVDATLPVELSYFNASFTSDLFVKIAWISQSETNHSGYNIMRSVAMNLESAIRINPELICQGTQNGGQVSYTFTDKELVYNSTLYYWLESVSLSGESQFYGPIRVQTGDGGQEPETPGTVVQTRLHNAYPNPFNPATNISYSISEPTLVQIDIFNSRGQLIRSLSSYHSAQGTYALNWDGKDSAGNLVGSGVYLYNMRTDNYAKSKKMILMK